MSRSVLSEPMMGATLLQTSVAALRKWAAREYYGLLWLKGHFRFRPQLPHVTLKPSRSKKNQRLRVTDQFQCILLTMENQCANYARKTSE